LQFHGCAGRSIEHERQFATIANAAGYVAFSFDSNGPRGIDRATALETVCRGTALIGQERAGDIAAAIEIVRRRSDIDPDRLVLAGWSHGAWSAMDYLTFAAAGKNPPGVGGAPPSALSGVILFYPYCGPGARARFARWSTLAPSLALVAGADEVVDGLQCRALFDRAAAKDEGISIAFFADANHVFDHRELAGADRRYFNEGAARDAEARYRAFLDAANSAR
jgi:dienelactone hydrolase